MGESLLIDVKFAVEMIVHAKTASILQMGWQDGTDVVFAMVTTRAWIALVFHMGQQSWIYAIFAMDITLQANALDVIISSIPGQRLCQSSTHFLFVALAE
jgi:hypothetical protein